jgi:hypothetical protein
MKDYEFLEPAQIELQEEVKYYDEQQSGLGLYTPFWIVGGILHGAEDD